jgi:hypothetical protein
MRGSSKGRASRLCSWEKEKAVMKALLQVATWLPGALEALSGRILD